MYYLLYNPYKKFNQFIIVGTDDEGVTNTNIYKRLRKNTLPYEFKILNQYYGSAKFISELERNIHTTIKEFSYIPKISFGGRYECFSSHIKELIITTSKDLYHAQPTGDNKSNV